MAIKKNTKTTLIDIDVSRAGKFSTIKVSKTESGKIRVAAQKAGVDAYVMTSQEAKHLAEALSEITSAR